MPRMSGAALVKYRQVVTKYCEECGVKFQGIKTEKYHNDDCKRIVKVRRTKKARALAKLQTAT